MTNEREKFFKTMQLKGEPEVRSRIHIWYQVWEELGESLRWLEDFSPSVSVGIDRKPIRAAGSETTDIWGCHWVYPLESHDGQCTGHPIASWSDLQTYQLPDPDKHTDWKQAEKNIQRARAEGKVTHGGPDHGFIFLRLHICAVLATS